MGKVKVIDVTVALEPRVKERPRLVRGKVITPHKTKAFQLAYRARFLAALTREQKAGLPLTGRLAVVLDFGFTTRPQWEGDLDNYTKAILDALQPTVIKNDKQVALLLARKTRVASPSIRAVLMPEAFFEWPYNE